MSDWLCIGGPLHGQYRPAGDKPIATAQTHAPVDYAISEAWWDGQRLDATSVRVDVAIPPRPVLYYPVRAVMPGWRFPLDIYLEAHLAAGAELPAGMVMPGGLQGAPLIAEPACRWCYGRPMDGFPVCSRSRCINNWSTIEAMATLDSSDIEGWTT
jgi:hypothetical protein